MPARIVAMIQLPPPMRSAESPTSAAPSSFSALACVASPKRVRR